MIKSKKIEKWVVCAMLVILSLTNIVAVIPTKATNYSGSNNALGSPLVNPQFTKDDWNKWEMLTFGVFLSNFATPFLDSYKSAFSSGHGGSEGSGRQALVFAAGGDVNSTSVLNSMLNQSITLQSDMSQLKELYTEYTVYDEKVKNEEESTAIVKKAATLQDLLVRVVRNDSGIKSDYSDKPFPYVLTNLDYFGGWSSKGELTIGSGNDAYEFEYITKASLPRIYMESGTDTITLFDISNGWDVQILSALIAAIIETTKSEKDIIKMLENAESYNLYMDSFGNICLVDGSNIKIVIPACSNQNITEDNRYNFLNSMVLNGNYINESDHTIAAGLEGTNQEANSDGDLLAEIRGGNYGVDGSSEGIEAGQLVIFEDTDIAIAQSLYSKGKIGDKKKYSWDDFSLGDYIIDIVKSKQDVGTISNPLKIEVVGAINEGPLAHLDGLLSGDTDLDGENIINRMAQASALISNMFPMETDHEVLNWMHNFNAGGANNGKVKLFDGAIYVANSVPKSKNLMGGKNANEGVKSYINYFFNYLSSNNTLTLNGLDIPGPSDQLEKVKGITTPLNLAGVMFNNNVVKVNWDSKGSELLVYYLWTDPHFGSTKGKKLEKFKAAKLKHYDDYIKNVDKNGKTQFNYENNLTDSARRIIKVYKENAVLKQASNLLSLQEGTEFSAYATLVYLSYLDFYGILDGEDKHNFKEAIFANSGFANLTADSALGDSVMTEEEKKKQILNNTYMLLSPESGRDYRNKLITNWLEDWMRQEYDNICYGNSSTSAVSSGISTRMAEGFLQIDTYEDNFLTSWFLDNYSKIVVVLIALFIVLVIVFGIIKNQKFSWFITSFGVVVLIFVLAPSTGEVTPYICNNMIQKMFSENMTYWAISESIENASVEKQYSTGSQQDRDTMSLVNSLNIAFLDKTIMVKKDISKKVIEKISVDFGDVQKLKSTRWMLPTLIQQISADNGSSDYVYTTLTDLYSDMRSMYWLYARNDLVESPTSQFVVPSKTYDAYSDSDKKGSVWGGYKSTSEIVDIDSLVSTSIQTSEEIGAGQTSKSITRIRESNVENFHTMFYMLDTKSNNSINNYFKIIDPLELTGKETYDKDTWDKFGESIAEGKFNAPNISNDNYKSSFKVLTQQLMRDASTYNSYNTEPKQSFGYLWTTETPAHFFYQVVKDTFQEDANAQNLAVLIKQLQGMYEVNSETGEETRRSFMHQGDTGYVRDILDLEEMFTNVIPYVYTVQVIAGGEDGTNGILGEELMEEYPIYENNMQSWLYRSNWVTKLVEYPEYQKACKITGRAEGGATVEYEIASPLYPQNYPAEEGRPMVFSEAQMHSLGLNEGDLSIVELKILKINAEVEKSWTLLINYSNTKGITKEVFYRQMAISALLSFNNHMSPDNWISASRALYPTTLDLRNISFDAVMKMIILSDTANSSYMSNNTMYGVISDGDTFSGLLLLGTAWMASYLVPFLRNLVLGLMFYLGILSMFKHTFQDGKKTAKSAGGFIVSNIVFMVVTVMYYGIYAAMITTSTVDSVLSIDNISMSTSVPTWKFLIIFIASTVYLVTIIKYINFLWKNYRDMGYEVYHGIMGGFASRLSNAFENVGNRLSGDIGSSRGSRNIVDNSQENNTTIKNGSENPVKVQTVDSDVHINNMNNSGSGSTNGVGDSGYIFESKGSDYTDMETSDIDKIVEEGKQ